MASSRTATAVEMPLNQYLSVLDQARQAADDAWYEKAAPARERIENLVAACMQQAGFTYHPVPLQRAESDETRGADLGVPRLSEDRTVVEQFGYGDFSHALAEDELSEPEAANQAYFESLGEQAKREYESTLSGEEEDDQPDRTGCVGKAEEEAGTPLDSVNTTDNSWFEDVEAEIQILFGIQIPVDAGQQIGLTPGSMQANPALMTLNRDWWECASNQGFFTDIPPKQMELVGPIASFSRATVLTRNGDVDQAIQLALADFDCRQAVNYIERYTQIQFDVEQEWVKAHQAELDKLLATWELQPKAGR